MISEADLCDIRTHCGHNARNLVTEHRRHWNYIVSGEKQVGVAEACGLHVDEDFAPNRPGNVHVLEIEPEAERVNYKCLHACGLLNRSVEANYRSKAAGIGTVGWSFAGFDVAHCRGIGWPSVSSCRVPLVDECDNGCQIRPRYLYYQTNRDKVSEWNCGI